LNTWLVQLYTGRYNVRPTYPVYHMAQALLGIKMAYEQAATEQGRWPTTEEVIAAFEYLEYPTPSGLIRLAIGSGHQAVEPAVYGITGAYDPATGEVAVMDLIVYPSECVNPPQGKTTEQWIREGFPGAQCPEASP
jgi:branched-chain amino acid transport system substrate-binding protein